MYKIDHTVCKKTKTSTNFEELKAFSTSEHNGIKSKIKNKQENLQIFGN